mmetsp:Transcript_4308/g.13452  ORF Transcript_4308/g.13452 Transcript_4308/m.13452 type:complete len:244 (+) Transcript_4308:113-844(+)
MHVVGLRCQCAHNRSHAVSTAALEFELDDHRHEGVNGQGGLHDAQVMALGVYHEVVHVRGREPQLAQELGQRDATHGHALRVGRPLLRRERGDLLKERRAGRGPVDQACLVSRAPLVCAPRTWYPAHKVIGDRVNGVVACTLQAHCSVYYSDRPIASTYAAGVGLQLRMHRHDWLYQENAAQPPHCTTELPVQAHFTLERAGPDVDYHRFHPHGCPGPEPSQGSLYQLGTAFPCRKASTEPFL